MELTDIRFLNQAKKIVFVMVLSALWLPVKLFAQAPNIAYASPQTYTVNVAISPLTPSNSGGAVPTTVGYVTTIAGKVSNAGTFINGTGSVAGFNMPNKVATDAAGNIYTADAGNNVIRKITPAGVVTTFAGSGAATTTNGVGTSASFKNPLGIASDASDNLYVAEGSGNCIRKITPNGVVTTIAGSGIAGSNNDTGIAATFSNPSGLAVDAAGNIYVADSGNNLIRKITSAGVVTTLAGNTTPGFTDGGALTGASFNKPYGVAVDVSGNVYVADALNYAVRKITADGMVSTIAGDGFSAEENGPDDPYTFQSPLDVTVDGIGNVYVADYYRIIKIAANGDFSAFAGPFILNNVSYASVDGPPETADFVGAAGVTIGRSGNLFLCENTDALIRRVNITGPYFITPALPTGLTLDQNTGIISGTPTATSPATNYTVTAANSAGNSAATVRIAVTIAGLSNLTVSAGSLSPVFAATSLSYKDTVSNATSSITVTPTTSDAGSTIKVNGTSVTSGTASGSIPVAVGNTTLNIVVTAADGVTKKSYSVVVTRVSNNAYLTNLTISSGTLSPAFAMTTSSYAVSVSNSTASVTVTPTLNNPHATIKVNGSVVVSGSASATIPLAVGNTTINTVITAQDGITKKNYTIVVTRVSNNAYLSNLTISSGTLSPAFAVATGGYTASVSNATTSVTVTPALNNPHSSVKVNGTTVVSGTASADIPLNVGANTISTVVTAQDGITHKTYTITVTRASGGLNSLYLPGGGEQTALVTSLNQNVEVNNILSPNGDGINDIWVVKNISFYPDNTVTVYDRAGKIVFTRKGYTNDWDGTYRGSVLSEGTYYYLVDLGNGKNFKGTITVVVH